MIAKIKMLSLLIFLVPLSTLFSQSFTSKTLDYDGEIREYDVYVPEIYDGTSQVPLIFNFHGGNGDIASQVAIADMRSIADTAGFIIVYPQALPDPNDDGSTNWLHKDPTTVDDVFFVDAMIDTLSQEYEINLDRVYACGYSLGGEFTYELGCRLNDKIAAIGVVARTMQTVTLNNCSPLHPTGVLTILGTADAISPYDGLVWGGIEYYIPADEVHNYWISYNNCDSIPVFSELPNTSTSDGSTVEKYSWQNENGCVLIEHLKVIDGGHDWPGSFGNMDIDATQEIWNFVSRFDLNGQIGCTTTGINEITHSQVDFRIYPNPFTDQLTIETDYSDAKDFKIYTLLGELVLTGSINSANNSIDLSSLTPNVYFFKTENQTMKLIKTE